MGHRERALGDEATVGTERPRPTRSEIVRRAYEAFQHEASAPPPMSLRAGDAVDSYDHAPPFDAALDSPSDEYVGGYGFHALPHLDPASWRHYLPRLIEFTFGHLAD